MSDNSDSDSPSRSQSPVSNGKHRSVSKSFDREDYNNSRSVSQHSNQNNGNVLDRSRSVSPKEKKKSSISESRKNGRSLSRSPDTKRKSRKKSRSYRSRSLSRSRSASRSRRRSRSRSQSYENYRVHVSDLPSGCSKTRIEEEFEKFGKLIEVWLARNPPCFAFIVFKNRRDGERAIREMDGQYLFGTRIRVSWAKPRTRGMRAGGGRRARDLNLRCYQCGEIGHFSRDCREVWHQKKGYYRGKRLMAG